MAGGAVNLHAVVMAIALIVFVGNVVYYGIQQNLFMIPGSRQEGCDERDKELARALLGPMVARMKQELLDDVAGRKTQV